ncbi:M20 family metallopeptidase [Geosporobacter ferrireducens]|uniref:M20 family metallopeptidase n=1 Tax=Geosporobacter ferrireducens TaxID=1424294 RepID=UPI00139D7877|nr:M20 family metallopeptidase [Geosporobacter ferrireducens]MTI54697.1 M20 family metallopeptidase [Geosporobacter ferrireducens]
MKDNIFAYIDSIQAEIHDMADYIFDNPEIGFGEHKAAERLTNYLDKNGFRVECGIGGLETAFRAVYENGEGGPSIGMLCEYDALINIGHACAHHMQGPSIVAAAIALKNTVMNLPYKLVIYGTPAEETSGGKIIMLKNGCFKDIDIALMMHGSPTTTTDVKCMALSSFAVTFKGKSAHAAIEPEMGRSALDALLLAFHGIECLREHVKEDTRMHYTVTNAGGPDNVVPGIATGTFALRSYNRKYLDHVVDRFKNIIKGAALMTGTRYDILEDNAFDSKIPVIKLNDLLMENARLVNAPAIKPAREKTGSTDFGNVMYNVPGSCIRIAFVDEKTAAHSQEYLDAGKTEKAHEAEVLAAKILAASSYDIIANKVLLEEIKEEFKNTKAAMSDF